MKVIIHCRKNFFLYFLPSEDVAVGGHELLGVAGHDERVYDWPEARLVGVGLDSCVDDVFVALPSEAAGEVVFGLAVERLSHLVGHVVGVVHQGPVGQRRAPHQDHSLEERCKNAKTKMVHSGPTGNYAIFQRQFRTYRAIFLFKRDDVSLLII
jgi:hypothetical protein